MCNTNMAMYKVLLCLEQAAHVTCDGHTIMSYSLEQRLERVKIRCTHWRVLGTRKTWWAKKPARAIAFIHVQFDSDAVLSTCIITFRIATVACLVLRDRISDVIAILLVT